MPLLKGQHVEKTNILQCATDQSLETFWETPASSLFGKKNQPAESITAKNNTAFIVKMPPRLTGHALLNEYTHIKMEVRDN